MEDVSTDELQELLGGGDLVLLDVRTRLEYDGTAAAHCDPRHGHIPGAVNVPLEQILECRSANEVRELVGAPEGADVVAYCHVGTRSGYAVQVLRGAGYCARNYAGSWHEWSRAVEEEAPS